MTATPKADEGANNLDYFGEPVYTYSLLQGINDGFLAPYRVTADFINIDLQGWTPEEGETDLLGKEIEQKLYQRQNIGRDLAIKLRRKVVAHRITQMLYDIGRMTKTIVFCSDIEEAAEMRTLLINMNSDLCKKSPYYVTRIVGEDKEGKKGGDDHIAAQGQPVPGGGHTLLGPAHQGQNSAQQSQAQHQVPVFSSGEQTAHGAHLPAQSGPHGTCAVPYGSICAGRKKMPFF